MSTPYNSNVRFFEIKPLVPRTSNLRDSNVIIIIIIIIIMMNNNNNNNNNNDNDNSLSSS